MESEQRAEPNEIVLQFVEADRWLRSRIAKVLGEEDLNLMEWLVLCDLCSSQRKSVPSRVAQRLGIKVSQVSPLIVNLRDKGFLLIKGSKADRREKNIVISAGGRKLLAKLEPEMQDLLSDVFEGFEKRDVVAYFTVLLGLRLKSRSKY